MKNKFQTVLVQKCIENEKKEENEKFKREVKKVLISNEDSSLNRTIKFAKSTYLVIFKILALVLMFLACYGIYMCYCNEGIRLNMYDFITGVWEKLMNIISITFT